MARLTLLMLATSLFAAIDAGKLFYASVSEQNSAAANPDVGMVCPDRSQCPARRSACCRTPDAKYNCCKYPNNVCCNDGLHCCPSGSVCDLIKLVCVRNSPFNTAGNQEITPIKASEPNGEKTEREAAVVPWSVKQPAATVPPADDEKANVVWCDAVHYCPSGNTCCMQRSGHWGCCKMPVATCCNDGVHCCPHRMHCTSAGTCVDQPNEDTEA